MSEATEQTKPLNNPDKELPISWPVNLKYLRRHTRSAAIPEATLQALNQPTKTTAVFPKFQIANIPVPNPSVQVVPINHPTHPAHGEAGLFATKHLAPSTLILPYMGHLHTNDPEDTDPSSSYDITLDRELGLSIDASKAGNEARFINDYRGVKDKPNAEFKDMWVRVGEKKWERWIGVFVLNVGKAGLRKSGIRGGEEIVVSYGKGFWEDRKNKTGHGGDDVEEEDEEEEEEEEEEDDDDDDDDDDDEEEEELATGLAKVRFAE